MTDVVALCDVDGVIANFRAAAVEAARLPPEAEHRSSWNFYEEEMSSDDFYGLIDRVPGFWEDVPVYPWATYVVGILRKWSSRFLYLTAPTKSVECPSGKVAWLRKTHFLSANSTRYMIGRDKDLLAPFPGSLLIDDRTENVEAFRAAGGTAMLFPAPSNVHSDLYFQMLETGEFDVLGARLMEAIEVASRDRKH